MPAGDIRRPLKCGSARRPSELDRLPVCFPGLGESEDKHQPPSGQENEVWAMNRLDKIKSGTDEEKAIQRIKRIAALV